MESIKNVAPEWAKRLIISTEMAALGYAKRLFDKGYCLNMRTIIGRGISLTSDSIALLVTVRTSGLEKTDSRYYHNMLDVNNIESESEEEFERRCSFILHELENIADTVPVIE